MSLSRFPRVRLDACAVAAGAGFRTMVVDLAASRILAPYNGVSLHSWTGIIVLTDAHAPVDNLMAGLSQSR